MAYGLTITGAGEADVNGDGWALAGTKNSRPYWSYTAVATTWYCYMLDVAFPFPSDWGWVIATSLTADPMSDNMYGVEGNTDQVPPKFGWAMVNSPSSPAPTSVAGDQEAVVLSGAGTTAVNDRFVWADITNSKGSFVNDADDHNMSYNGTDWQIRTGTTIGSGTLLYSNTDDGDSVPTTGWTVDGGSSPAPSGFTTEILSLVEDEFVRINSTDTGTYFSVYGGSGETLDEVIGRDTEHPSTPAGRDPSIKDNIDASSGFSLFGLTSFANTPHEILGFDLRIYGEIVGSNGFCRKYKITAGGVSSGEANVTCSGNTGVGWFNPDTFDANTNAGSITWPIPGTSTILVGIKGEPSATSNNVGYYSLCNVWVDYTYWGSASASLTATVADSSPARTEALAATVTPPLGGWNRNRRDLDGRALRSFVRRTGR